VRLKKQVKKIKPSKKNANLSAHIVKHTGENFPYANGMRFLRRYPG
jgi:hypothetical protein